MVIDYDLLGREYAKCFKDKSRIYMIRNYLKTKDNNIKKEVPFDLFPQQETICRALGGEDIYGDGLGANSLIFSKYRQAGITTTVGGFIACEMCLADSLSPQTALVIGNTLDLAQLMLVKIKEFLLQFPLWMWGDEYMDLGYDPLQPPPNKNVIFTTCNTKELVLKNKCKVVARSSGPDASRGVGGVQWLIFDEAAFIENGRDVYASALPNVSNSGRVVIISTPSGKDRFYYETYRRAKLRGTEGWNGFTAIDLSWICDPRYSKFLEWTKKDEETGEIIVQKDEYIDKEGTVKYNEEKWKKLKEEGWKPRSPWYIRMCREFNNDQQKIAQELECSFLGSASNVVDPEFIEMQENLNVRDPLYTDNMLEDTWVWKEPVEGHRYVMAIDNSRGDADDSTALEIIDIDGVDEDGKPCVEQVLEYNGKLRGDDMGEVAFNYGMMYNAAFTVVDCIGGTGDACVLMMERKKYPNLYYDDPNLKKYTMQTEASSVPLTNDGRLPGFHSSSVRFQMLTNFADMVKTNQLKIRSKRVISELETWIYKGSAGRIDHMDGCHDDTLTCLAMGIFVMQYSLKKYIEAREKTKVMLRAWSSSSKPGVGVKNNDTVNGKYTMPFVQQSNVKSNRFPYAWLIK